jgi:hypothetical protein
MAERLHVVTLLELARGAVRLSDVDRQGVVRSEAPGAYPNGSRVEKVSFEKGDFHSVGAMATVVGSVGPVEEGEYGYFVRWDDLADAACFVRGRKLRRP